MMKEKLAVSTALGSEHRWPNDRFEQFRWDLHKGDVNAHLFTESMNMLYRHHYLEEEILLPVLEVHGLADLTTLLVQEHGETCRFLNGVQAFIQRKAAPRRIQNDFKALHSLLEEHNFKEGRRLYPAADQMLQGGGFTQSLQQLKEMYPSSGWG